MASPARRPGFPPPHSAPARRMQPPRAAAAGPDGAGRGGLRRANRPAHFPARALSLARGRLRRPLLEGGRTALRARPAPGAAAAPPVCPRWGALLEGPLVLAAHLLLLLGREVVLRARARSACQRTAHVQGCLPPSPCPSCIACPHPSRLVPSATLARATTLRASGPALLLVLAPMGELQHMQARLPPRSPHQAAPWCSKSRCGVHSPALPALLGACASVAPDSLHRCQVTSPARSLCSSTATKARGERAAGRTGMLKVFLISSGVFPVRAQHTTWPCPLHRHPTQGCICRRHAGARR